MVKSFLENLPEVFISNTSASGAIHELVKAGKARKIGPRLYTRNMQDSDENIIARNYWLVVKGLFPHHVISHRTAIEMKPTPHKTIFLTGPYARTFNLPGIRIRVLSGPGPLEWDTPYLGDLWISSRPRAFLECLKVRVVRGAESSAVPVEQIESKLEQLLSLNGAGALNRLRDQARIIAPSLDAYTSFERLDSIIGTLQGTRSIKLNSPTAIALAAGDPYDPRRLEMFQILKDELLTWIAPSRPDDILSGVSFSNLAFIDAYFSNFIEGTEFEIGEAMNIVFHGHLPRARSEDAHDVLGTFRVVSSMNEMGESATRLEFDSFLAKLQRINGIILADRAIKRPGLFKEVPNRAGASEFVRPEYVRGTLKHGFDLLKGFPDPFQRAVFIMFVVAEVHPFDDGNGRLARAMMNTELISCRERRVFIPNVYCEDYLSALRAMTHDSNPTPLIRMVDFAQKFSARIDFADLDAAIAQLDRCSAFSTDADATLKMPSI